MSVLPTMEAVSVIRDLRTTVLQAVTMPWAPFHALVMMAFLFTQMEELAYKVIL